MTRLIAILTALFFLLVAGAPSAHAADEIALSTDGVTWSSALDDQLFTSPRLWVPGDDETRTFWVRNTANSPGSLVVEALGLEDPMFIQGAAKVRLQAGSLPWATLNAQSSSIKDTLQPGEAREINVNVRFAESAGNATQAHTFPLDFRLQLSGDTGSGPPSKLPQTGGPIPTFVLVGVILAVTCGTGLLLHARTHSAKENT